MHTGLSWSYFGENILLFWMFFTSYQIIASKNLKSSELRIHLWSEIRILQLLMIRISGSWSVKLKYIRENFLRNGIRYYHIILDLESDHRILWSVGIYQILWILDLRILRIDDHWLRASWRLLLSFLEVTFFLSLINGDSIFDDF